MIATREHYKDKLSVMIATPTRDNLINAEYVGALIEAIKNEGVGYSVSWGVSKGVSNIVEGRNFLTDQFLKSGMDVLLWIDSDTTWSVDHFNEMIKAIRKGHRAGCAPQTKILPINDMLEGKVSVTAKGFYIDGPGVYCSHSGHGFFFVTRSALAQVINQKRAKLVGVGDNAKYNFYTPIGDLSEDFSFCERLRKSRVPIFVLPVDGVGHENVVNYPGLPYGFLKDVAKNR